MNTRRKLAAAFAIGLAALFNTVVSQAGAPQRKGQAPGYYRMMLGDFEIVALADGTLLAFDRQDADQHDAGARRRAVEAVVLADPMDVSDNAYLVNTGTKLVLIGAGCGDLLGPRMGNLVAKLRAAGYQPEQVDEIYITHTHGDHIGGMMGRRQARVPQRDRPRRSTRGELVPGIKALSTYGHTKGHTIYIVESNGQKLALLRDLMHVAAVQFVEPSVTIPFDTDAEMAAGARKKVYADRAEQGFWLAAAHLSFPGIGHIRPDAHRYGLRAGAIRYRVEGVRGAARR